MAVTVIADGVAAVAQFAQYILAAFCVHADDEKCRRDALQSEKTTQFGGVQPWLIVIGEAKRSQRQMVPPDVMIEQHGGPPGTPSPADGVPVPRPAARPCARGEPTASRLAQQRRHATSCD